MASGNLAIRDHANHGKDLYLFAKTSKAFVKCLGQMVCRGYEDVPTVPYRQGNMRTVIVFYLRDSPDAESVVSSGDEERVTADAEPHSNSESTSLERLRAFALAAPLANVPVEQAGRNVYLRSEAVRAYVLRRAAGRCEGCGQPAPFQTPSGRPYLEPHHTRRLSDGAPDHPAHVIALCPTCHRRAHYAIDSAAFNDALIEQLRRLEPIEERRRVVLRVWTASEFA